jgi:imidazolonepropionase-like amidohydrolase
MKNIIKSIFLLLLLAGTVSTGHSQVVGKPEYGTFALTNATIETITNETIEKGTLVVSDGKITALGTNVSIPAGAKTIDCSGHIIYPGMIDGGTYLGLLEVGSISLTQDYSELGSVKPHMKALTAVNPNAVAIPITRVSGVTTAITMPAGGRVPGQAALINLVGYTPDQMYAGFTGMVLNFPSAGRSSRWDRRSDDERKQAEEKALKELNDLWDEAALFADIHASAQKDKSLKVDYNPEMEAMVPVVRGEMPVLVEVNAEKDILSAIRWVKEKKVKAVFTGVSEGWRVAESLALAGIPVITGPVQGLPTRASDRYDRAYANAGLMHKAGVKVALRTMDENNNYRNLPFHAGFAAAYGLGREEALKAITINPAEILGVADRLGSLEVGKSATLFVADGDALETKTQVKHVFIDGWLIPMDSRQIQLYNEFLDRQPGVRK